GHELLVALSDRPDRTSYDVVRVRFANEAEWRRALHEGVASPTAAPVNPPKIKKSSIPPASPVAAGLEIVFRPHPSTYDGRFANNAWLQELPRPMTKMTWDNAAYVAPADALRLGISTGDVVELALGGRSVRAPVWVLPGQAPGSVAVHLGYG